MTSVCKHAKGTITNTTDSTSRLEATKKHFTIAMALAVMFGLGWAFGLAATSLPVKELTITFQVLFSLFVGLQGFLIFLLHGLRNMEARNIWRKWLGMAANAGKSLYLITASSAKTLSGHTSQNFHGTTSSSMMTLSHIKEATSVDKICDKHIYKDICKDSTPHQEKEKPL